MRRRRARCCLLGSSMGGELFNPGAVEIAKLSQLTAMPASDVVARIRGLNCLSCGVILVGFLAGLWQARAAGGPSQLPRAGSSSDEPARAEERRLNLAKAVVPLLPILLLTVDSMAGSVFSGPVSRRACADSRGDADRGRRGGA